MTLPHGHRRARRADGTVISAADLAEAVPMLVGELEDIAYLIDLIEEWLRLEHDARLKLAEYLVDDGVPTTIWDLIHALGAASLKLHRLVLGGNTLSPVYPD